MLLYKQMLKNATLISDSVTKTKFARVHGKQIKVASKPITYETQNDSDVRHLAEIVANRQTERDRCQNDTRLAKSHRKQ